MNRLLSKRHIKHLKDTEIVSNRILTEPKKELDHLVRYGGGGIIRLWRCFSISPQCCSFNSLILQTTVSTLCPTRYLQTPQELCDIAGSFNGRFSCPSPLYYAWGCPCVWTMQWLWGKTCTLGALLPLKYWLSTGRDKHSCWCKQTHTVDASSR